MSVFGTTLRIGIVCTWLGLVGWHALGFLAPGVGRTLNSEALVASHLDHTLAYVVHRTQNATPVASCRFSVQRDDARFRALISVMVSDPSALPGLGLLAATFGSGSHQTMTATIEQQLDARFRLESAHAFGSAFGTTFEADGRRDLQRFIGRYRLADGAWKPYELPGIGDESTTGTGMVVTLPPGMKPGDAFTTRITGIDPIRMAARPTIASFTVEAREPITVANHLVDTVRVVMSVDQRATATLWCGDDGVAYRITLISLGLVLDLDSITDTSGAYLWPTKSAASSSSTPQRSASPQTSNKGQLP